MLKVVADVDIPFLKGALEPFADVVYEKGGSITNLMLRDTDVLITRTRTLCTEELLRDTKIRLIASATIGHDHIDKEYCIQQGIKWVNAPGCNAGSVQQYFASALSVILEKSGPDLKDTTIGVIGAGNVGKKVISIANTLGIRTLINDPPRARAEGGEGFCDLLELLESSDIVTLHVPLNRDGADKTLHLANDAFFDKMKEEAWLINTSRGEVVDTDSLKVALQTDKLSGAILDVWENEPKIDLELLKMATIATPHIAGYSADGKANGTTMVVREISRFFDLGIDSWSPSNIPPPPKPVLQVSENAKSPIQIFCELSLQAYPILEDHKRLLKDPSNFEDFRSNYPIRREPPTIGVVTKTHPEDLVDLISELGYRVI